MRKPSAIACLPQRNAGCDEAPGPSYSAIPFSWCQTRSRRAGDTAPPLVCRVPLCKRTPCSSSSVDLGQARCLPWLHQKKARDSVAARRPGSARPPKHRQDRALAGTAAGAQLAQRRLRCNTHQRSTVLYACSGRVRRAAARLIAARERPASSAACRTEVPGFRSALAASAAETRARFPIPFVQSRQPRVQGASCFTWALQLCWNTLAGQAKWTLADSKPSLCYTTLRLHVSTPCFLLWAP